MAAERLASEEVRAWRLRQQHLADRAPRVVRVAERSFADLHEKSG